MSPSEIKEAAQLIALIEELKGISGSWKKLEPEVAKAKAALPESGEIQDMLDQGLIMYVLRKDPKGVRIALELGANVNATDHADRTAVTVAADEGGAKVVQILIDYEADLSGDEFKNPVFVATVGADAKSLEILLEAKAPIAKGTLRMAALNDGKKGPQLCQLLVDAGCNVDEVHHGTPLMAACGGGNLENAKVLLDGGAEVNHVTEGSTAIHRAIADKKGTCLELLIARGADLPSADKVGEETLLELARSMKHRNCVKLLEQAGLK